MTITMDKVFKMRNVQESKKRSVKADRKRAERQRDRAKAKKSHAHRMSNFKKACKYAREF